MFVKMQYTLYTLLCRLLHNEGCSLCFLVQTFAPGAVEYLDLAMEWGCRHGLAVMVSMHAPKGSQNGFENSAPAVEFVAYWSHYPENVQNTLDVVRFIVERQVPCCPCPQWRGREGEGCKIGDVEALWAVFIRRH
jgi:hypothetical protein